uniref:Uncharacterized protein n=1 Tax=Hyaloperonospora arabidopsidis (strain Emoy2) TaxID=559515 RepID=M4BNS5_HYAAE
MVMNQPVRGTECQLPTSGRNKRTYGCPSPMEFGRLGFYKHLMIADIDIERIEATTRLLKAAK